MKIQQVITVTRKPPVLSDMNTNPSVMNYPEIDEMLEKGMYVESLTQSVCADNNFVITFVIRHYNETQASV